MNVTHYEGNWTCKAGFAGESAPQVEFPSIVGRLNPKESAFERIVRLQKEKDASFASCFVGYEAQSKRGNKLNFNIIMIRISKFQL